MKVILYRNKGVMKENQKPYKIVNIDEEGDIYRNIARALGRVDGEDVDSLWFISQQGFERFERVEDGGYHDVLQLQLSDEEKML